MTAESGTAVVLEAEMLLSRLHALESSTARASASSDALAATMQALAVLHRSERRRPMPTLLPVSEILHGHLVLCENEAPERVYVAVDPETARHVLAGAARTTLLRLIVEPARITIRYEAAVPVAESPIAALFIALGTPPAAALLALAQAEIELERQGGQLSIVGREVDAVIPAVIVPLAATR